MRQRVKCVTDSAGYALYFSRGAIPWNKDGAVRSFPAPWEDKPYLLHLGLQCYDRNFLTEYCRMAPTPLMVTPPGLHAFDGIDQSLGIDVQRLFSYYPLNHWLDPLSVASARRGAVVPR